MKKIINRINRVCNKIVRHLGWYKEYWNGATKFWNQPQFNIDIVNLGSGAAVYAFDYTNSIYLGANWALSPQSLVHDFNILRNYFSFIREGGVVLITVCPFSGLFSTYGKSHNLKYYTFLHPATIDNFKEEERIKALKLKLNPIKEYPAFCIKQTVGYILKRSKGIIKRKPKIDYHVSAEEMMNSWKSQFGINDLRAPLSHNHLEELNSRKETLMEMIEFCNERALKPIVVIPPMHPFLSFKFPPEFFCNYIKPLIHDIDAPVFNYMYDDSLSDDKYYRTALFMSEKGASLFTESLINRLINEHYIN